MNKGKCGLTYVDTLGFARTELRERLEISDGLERASGSIIDGGDEYSLTAIVPIDRWRPLSDQEFAALQAPLGRARLWDTVLLTRPPASVRNELEAIANRTEALGQSITLESSSPAIINHIENALDLWSDILMAGPVFGVARKKTKSGLRTATPTFDPTKRTGLHVDSWDRLAWFDRRAGSNRLCINCGQEPRYFLFVPRLVATLWWENLHLSQEEKSRDFPFLYMNSNLDTPVLRLRIDPGDAYIAPTENLIHDGSTLGQSTEDISLTVRGFLVPTPCQEAFGQVA